MSTTHPAGTPVSRISGFDRTTKVSIHCPVHPEAGSWRTKDPWVSSWFGEGTPCECRLADYTTTAEYTSLF